MNLPDLDLLPDGQFGLDASQLTDIFEEPYPKGDKSCSCALKM